MYKKLLIIDKDDSNRQHLLDSLCGIYNVVEARSCEEAVIKLLRQYNLIKLIMVSIDALRQDNYQIVSQLKKNVSLCQIPIICIGNPRENPDFLIADEKEARQNGVLDFLVPPFDIEILHSRINNLIQFQDTVFLGSMSHNRNAIKKYEQAASKSGTFWNPNSLESMIMRTYVGAACILESMQDSASILQANDKFAKELLGPDAVSTDILSTNAVDHMDKDNLAILLQTLRCATGGTEEATCELQLIHFRADQPLMHVRFSIKLIDQVKERRLFYCTLENDTEQFEAQRRERALSAQLQVIIQNMSGGVSAVYMTDGQLNYIYANEKFFQMFGFTQEQFVTELPNGIYDLILPEYLSQVQDAVYAFSEVKETLQLEYKAKRRDGSLVWIRSRNSICALDSVNKPVYITIYVDITSQKESEERIRTINDKLGNSEIFIQLDITHKIVEEYRSKYETAASMAKWEKEGKVYEKLMLSSIYEKDKSSALQALSFAGLAKHYAAGDTKLSIEYRRHMPNGEIRWFCATAILLEAGVSGIVNASIYSHDIDARIKKRNARYKIVDTDVNAISIINIANGLAQAVKPSPENHMPPDTFFNYDEEVQIFIQNNVAEEDQLRCRKFFSLETMLTNVKNHGYFDFSFWLVPPDNRNLRINVHISYLDSTHNDLLMVGRDITVLFEKEQKQQLALQHAAELANNASQAKSDFLSRMSHDMRTPLNAILGLTELAKQEKASPEIANYIKSIDNSGHYLLSLINDTLDLSKIESGKMQLKEESFEMEEFLLGLNTVIKPLMDDKEIAFLINLNSGTSSIVIDKLRFTQVFYNLLSNAAKYTNKGGHVSLSSEQIPGKNGKFGMRFIIQDDGIGMSREYQKILFDPFTQEGRPEAAERKGTGLGMAIVKRIITAMGGTIHVKSQLGKGTEFIVDLYVHTNLQESCVSDKVQEYDDSTLRGLHILLVDDAALNVMILKKILEYKGCFIDMATNGLEAVNAFEASAEFYYDIVLTDIRMPVMDGLEEARRIRGLDRKDAKSVPIIAATADAYSEDQDKTLSAGINARLVKPIETKILCRTIIDLIKERK